MSVVVVECVCGYSCAIEKVDLERHPGSVVECAGVINGKRCKRQHKVSVILREERRGVYRAADPSQAKQELPLHENDGSFLTAPEAGANRAQKASRF